MLFSENLFRWKYPKETQLKLKWSENYDICLFKDITHPKNFGWWSLRRIYRLKYRFYIHDEKDHCENFIDCYLWKILGFKGPVPKSLHELLEKPIASCWDLQKIWIDFPLWVSEGGHMPKEKKKLCSWIALLFSCLSIILSPEVTEFSGTLPPPRDLDARPFLLWPVWHVGVLLTNCFVVERWEIAMA